MSSIRNIQQINVWPDGKVIITYPDGSIEEYRLSGDLADGNRFSSASTGANRGSTGPAPGNTFCRGSPTPFAMTPSPPTENRNYYEGDLIPNMRTPSEASSKYVLRSRATTPVCYPYESSEPGMGIEQAAENSESDDNSSECDAVEKMLERNETPISEASLDNGSDKENLLPSFFRESKFLQGFASDYIPPPLSASSDNDSALPNIPAEKIARMQMDQIMAQTNTIKDCIGFGYVPQELGRMDSLELVRSPSGLLDCSESVQPTKSEDPILPKERYYAVDEMVPPTPPMSPQSKPRDSEAGPIRTRNRTHAIAQPRRTRSSKNVKRRYAAASK